MASVSGKKYVSKHTLLNVWHKELRGTFDFTFDENTGKTIHAKCKIKKALSKEGYKTFSKALHEYKVNGDYIKVTAVLADLFTSTSDHFHLFRKFYRFVRAKHKQQFDELCKDITGEGVGYKPEHSISNKRLQPQISSGSSEKKAKLFDSRQLPSVEENNMSVSTNKLLTNSAHLNTISNCLLSSTTSSVKPQPSLDNSQPLSEEQVNTVNEILSSSNQSKTGYICCLCKKDATVPFEAPCQHSCCLECWRKVLDGDKLCPGENCGIRIRRRYLIQRLFASGPNISQ